MALDFSNFWSTLLIITGIFFLALAINITIKIVYGEEAPYKECIEYSDGQLAIINFDCGERSIDIIKWFLDKGYSLDIAVSDVETTSRVFMTRNP